MVLDYLKNQQNEPDPELLKKLGWSKEDLRRFVQRWERLKREAIEASADGESAGERMEQLLRGLGLQAERDRMRRDRHVLERTAVSDSGQRSEPPDEYAEQYRAFLRSRQP
jgi:hypothetical protein